MKVVELFAGVGGFRIALERAGHEVVFANEWDKYAAQTYNKNFGGPIDQHDITQLSADDIPAHDIICGGFPCQAFSVAGKRKGFDETRGTLFFEILRIARHHRTKYLFLENVKGLLNHDGGRTFEVILEALDESGYDAQWQVLNSKDFGVPQNRERVIIVANLRTEPRPKIFPIGRDDREIDVASSDVGNRAQAIATRHLGRNGKLISDLAPTVQATETPHVITGTPKHHEDGSRRVEYSYSDTVPTITATYGKSADTQPRIVQVNATGLSAANRVYADGLAPTLSANGGGLGAKTGLYAIKKDHGEIVPTRDEALTLDANYHKGLDNHGQRTGVVDGIRIRRLTPVECERLQGFPDNWTAGVSDTQRYKQMGNAVTVNVIEAVARRLES